MTGLAPAPAEVAAFVADKDPAAYEKLVDRLLASPAFGERMAWDWLDAARYADSNGYQGDGERTMWPWRDWVVEAFNRNLPYDQFTVWQLAGDLLPGATDEQRLATGFCRNHPINGEGGRISEENRVDYVIDMAETTATVWLGLTTNCCRCHDHKFDPLTRGTTTACSLSSIRRRSTAAAAIRRLRRCWKWSPATSASSWPAWAPTSPGSTSS